MRDEIKKALKCVKAGKSSEQNRLVRVGPEIGKYIVTSISLECAMCAIMHQCKGAPTGWRVECIVRAYTIREGYGYLPTVCSWKNLCSNSVTSCGKAY